MIDSSNLTQAEFIRIILERDIRNIYKAQHLIAINRTYLEKKDLRIKKRRRGITRGTGNLENALNNPNFFMKSQGEEFITSSSVPLYMRFLDMKQKGNFRIYNRQIWGILYNNAYPDIRYGFGKEIQDRVGSALQEAINKNNK